MRIRASGVRGCSAVDCPGRRRNPHDPPLTAAVVGTGFIGPVHVEALRRLGRPVVGVLGSSPEKRPGRRRRASACRAAYDTLRRAARRPGASSVVHLASPNRLHFDQCRQALAAGKHVVCEKPLAMTAAETAELVALAGGAAGGHAPSATTSASTRCAWRPAQRIADGRARRRLPRHRLVRAGLAAPRRPTSTGACWPSEGGALRAVADIGTHWLDLVQFDHRPGGRERLRRPADGPARRGSGRRARSRRSRQARRAPRETGAGRRSTRRTTARCCCASGGAPRRASRCRR